MRRLRIPNWNVIERTDEQITVRGPKGYIRLRKTLSEPKPFNQWLLTIKWDGEYIKHRDKINLIGQDDVWSTILTEIDRIRHGGNLEIDEDE